MKALISGFALLTFLAGTTLPLESYGQTSTGGTTTAAPDTGTPVTSPTKKSKKSKSHAKKKSTKPSANQQSSANQQHHSLSAAKHSAIPRADPALSVWLRDRLGPGDEPDAEPGSR
jgi:hypothetical protein